MDKKKIIGGLAAVVIVIGGVYFWQVKIQRDSDPFAAYEAAMKEDGAGGATPAETLAMFIAALRAGDDRAAAQLFMLDDYGSRAAWEARMADLKAQGVFGGMADDIEKNAKMTEPTYEGDAGYELLDDGGIVKQFLDMELNTFSGVWKLQSL